MSLVLNIQPAAVNMSVPTSAQIEALLNFLEEHRDLARGRLRSVEGRAVSHRLWGQICTTLNAMGGSTKTTKQWQKVWTDKKNLAEKAAAAAWRSASATGGGPSTAPPLLEWESRVISIMGDGFGEPQTTVRVPAFTKNTQEAPMLIPSAISLESQPEEQLCVVSQLNAEEHPRNPELFVQPGPSRLNPVSPNASRHRKRMRQQPALCNATVQDRLFRVEEQRIDCERQRNKELAGIKRTLTELCVLLQQIANQLEARNK